jgi:hypothetical protein
MMKKALWIIVALLFMGLLSDAEAAPRRQIRQVLRDQFGNTLASATCHVEVSTDKGSTWADASVYSTLAGSVAATGSNLTADSTGVCTGFLDDFDYNFTSTQFRVTATKTGYTSQTYSNILVGPQIGGTYTLAADTTVTTDLDIPYGVIISIPTGKYLTINGTLRAGLYQIFSCTDFGTLSAKPCVMFCPQTTNKYSSSGSTNADAITCSGKVTEVYPQWWGANPSNSSTSATATKNAINGAIRSLNPNQATTCSGSTCNMTIGPGGVVKIAGFFQVDGTINLTSGVSLEGLGTSNNWATYTSSMNKQSAIYCAQTDGTDCITSYVDSGMFNASCEITGYSEYQFNVSRPKGVTIRGLRITGNTSSGWGVVLGEPTKSTETYQSYCAGTSYPWRFTGAYDATIEENIIDSHGKGGMHLNCTAGSRIRKNWITGNKSHGIISVWDNAAQVFTENHFQNNCGTTSVSCTVVGVANDPCYNGIKLIYGYGNDITGNSFESSGAGGHGCQQGQTYIAASMGLSYNGNYHENSGATTYLDGVASTGDTITDDAHGLANGERVVFSTVVAGLTAGTHYYVVEKTADTFKVSTASGGTAENITADGAVTYRRSETQRGVHLALWNHGINVRDNFFGHNNTASSLYCDAVYIVPDYASSTEYQIADVIISGNTAATAEYNYCNPHLVNFSGRYPYARNITLENNGVRVKTPGITGHAYYNDADTIYTGISTYSSNTKIMGQQPVSDSGIVKADKARVVDTLINGGIFAAASNIKGLWVMDETGATSTIYDRSGNAHNATLKNAAGTSINASTLYPSIGGTAPALFSDGTTHFEAADHDDFTFATSPFSIVVLARPTDLPPTYVGSAPFTNVLFGKMDQTTGSAQMEYLFYVFTDGSTNKLRYVAFDNNDGSSMGRSYDTTIRTDVNTWRTYVMTNDGSGNASGVALYYDGARVDDTGAASITTMRNTTSVPGNVWIAADGSVNGFHGDYALALVVAEQLTASQVARIDALLRGWAGNNVSSSTSRAASTMVTGPTSSTDNAIARFDGTSGRVIQNSVVTITDDGAVTISATEGNDGVLNIWADEGDDTTDKWSIVAQAAASNALAVKNSTNEVFTISTGGTVNIPSGQTYDINGNPHSHAGIAADGSNCSAGYAALGVDASGNAQGCWQVTPAAIGAAASNASTTVNNQTCTLGSSCTITANLPSNPAACSAGQYVSDIAADGTLTCGTPAGAGDVTDVGDCSSGACYDGSADGGTYWRLYDGTSAYVGGTAGVRTLTLAPSNASAENMTITFGNNDDTVALASGTGAKVSINGNAATATALAADPADCSANQYANAINASGTLSCAQVAAAQVSGLGTMATEAKTTYLTVASPSSTGTHTHTAGTLNDGAYAINWTWTMDSSAGAENNGILWACTSAGSEAQNQNFLKYTIAAGYTGSAAVRGLRIEMSTAGTGNTISSTGATANMAMSPNAIGATAGMNIGSGGNAINGAINIGALGTSGDNEASQVNYGVRGIAKSTGAGGIAYGGHFSIDATSGDTTNSAVLVADNLTAEVNILDLRHNGSSVFKVDHTGVITGIKAGDLPAASDSAQGAVELATSAETTTGTDTGRAVTPDGLAGSDFGKRIVEIMVVAPTTDVSATDGQAYFVVPTELNGYDLVRVAATVITAGSTNSTVIDIYSVTQSHDVLSTGMNIETNETSTRTSATPGTIDTTYHNMSTGEVLRIDVTSVSTTKPKGLIVEMVFQLP